VALEATHTSLFGLGILPHYVQHNTIVYRRRYEKPPNYVSKKTLCDRTQTPYCIEEKQATHEQTDEQTDRRTASSHKAPFLGAGLII